MPTVAKGIVKLHTILESIFPRNFSSQILRFLANTLIDFCPAQGTVMVNMSVMKKNQLYFTKRRMFNLKNFLNRKYLLPCKLLIGN